MICFACCVAFAFCVVPSSGSTAGAGSHQGPGPGPGPGWRLRRSGGQCSLWVTGHRLQGQVYVCAEPRATHWKLACPLLSFSTFVFLGVEEAHLQYCYGTVQGVLWPGICIYVVTKRWQCACAYIQNETAFTARPVPLLLKQARRPFLIEDFEARAPHRSYADTRAWGIGQGAWGMGHRVCPLASV